MGREIIDYITQFETTQVSPIWGGAQVFHFLCLGHLNMAQALGFELEYVSEHDRKRRADADGGRTGCIDTQE